MEVTLTLPPQQFLMDSPDDVAEKIRLYSAVTMYQIGEISIGAACKIAGVDRYHFLDFLHQNKIPLQTQTADELEAEFNALVTEK